MNNSTIRLYEPSINEKEINAVVKVMLSLKINRGELTKNLEKYISEKFLTKNSILVSNGTVGLYAALNALGIQSGDEIITTPFTFVATTNVILQLGATPVYVDVDPLTYNLNPDFLEEKITKKTKAILSADLYGLAANYDRIKKIARKNNLYFISDSCQSIGATLNNKYVSQFADISVFSFFISKNIVSGEGGVILTNSDKIAKNVNLFINHGQTRGKKYDYKTTGLNFRPNDIQATILHEQLKKLELILEKRKNNAKILSSILSKNKKIITPIIPKNYDHTFSRYSIRILDNKRNTRNILINQLNALNIETEIVYPLPLYHYRHIKKYLINNSRLNNVELICKEILTIPVHQNLSENNIMYIATAIDKIIKRID